MAYSHALWHGCISALIVSLACAGLKELQSPVEQDLIGAEICAAEWVLASPNVVSFNDTGSLIKGGLAYHLVTSYIRLIAVAYTKRASDRDIPTTKLPILTPVGTIASNFNAVIAAPRALPMVKPMPVTKKTHAPKVAKSYPTKTKKKVEFDECVLPGKRADGTPTASGPETLSNAQISGVMLKANYSSCLAIGTGKVQMKVTVSSSGSVTNAEGDGTPLGNCVAGMVRRLKFPMIYSPSQTFPYPVTVAE
jgi:hypothetical protein